MIYITGDIHCPNDVHKLTTGAFKEQNNMTKNDYLIICGDMGIVWDDSATDKYWRRWFNDKHFTTLFVDGNHENFDLLNKYKPIEWKGGMVHQIEDTVFHLMRGEIFNINGSSFLAMGGAPSHDKAIRTLGKNLWQEEVPDSSERRNAIENIKGVDFVVDYIITHDVPTYVLNNYFNGFYKPNEFTDFLDRELLRKVYFKKWFSGHYHIDETIQVAKSHTDEDVKNPMVFDEDPVYFANLHILFNEIMEICA